MTVDRSQAHQDVEALMSASRLLTAIVARTLADAHDFVTTPQLRILVMLSARGPLNLGSVARGLGVNASHASRTCEQLVHADLISRHEDPHDRRHVVLELTSDGAALVRRLMDQRRELFEQITGVMSAADRAVLTQGLDGFVRAASDLAMSKVAVDDEDSLPWLT